MREEKNTFKFINFIIDYLPIILTFIMASIAPYISIKSDTQVSEMLQFILVILTLLATSLLADRFRIIRKIDQKVKVLGEYIKNSESAETFFIDRIPPLETRLLNAKSIAISGITLSRTSDSMLNIFEECINKGGNVRILLIDPEHIALEIAVKRFHKHQSVEMLKHESHHALNNFMSLSRKINDRNKFDIKLVRASPAYGIWLIDGDNINSEIWVELYSYRDLPEPTFHLQPYKDGKWHNYFLKQFELLWTDANRYDT